MPTSPYLCRKQGILSNDITIPENYVKENYIYTSEANGLVLGINIINYSKYNLKLLGWQPASVMTKSIQHFDSVHQYSEGIAGHLFNYITHVQGKSPGFFQEFFKKSQKKVAETPNFSKSH